MQREALIQEYQPETKIQGDTFKVPQERIMTRENTKLEPW